MLSNVKKSMDTFGRYVVQQSRSNLTKGGHNVDKKLYNSIGFEVNEYPNSFSFSLEMEDYADFLDRGVRGSNPSLVKNGRQKAPLSPYTFKNRMPPMIPIMNWAKKRNIRLRNTLGQFAKGNYRTIGFILQKRIFAQGTPPTYFWSDPFNKAFKDLPDDIIEAYALDLTNFMNFSKK